MDSCLRLLCLTLSFCLMLVARSGMAEVPAIPSCNGGAPVVFEARAGLPLTIPTGPATVASTITVSGVGSYLWDLDLITNLFHTFPADMTITLRSPLGTEVTIAHRQGYDSDNVFNGTLWDDQASPGDAIPYASNPRLVTDANFLGGLPSPHLVPQEGFEAFRGENPNGPWTLQITDSRPGDGGTLTAWSMSLTTLTRAPTIGAPLIAQNANQQVIPVGRTILLSSSISVGSGLPPGTTVCGVELDTSIQHSASQDLNIALESPLGRIATVTTGNGELNDHVFNGTAWRMRADAEPSATSRLVTTHPYQNLVTATPLVPEESFGTFLGQPLIGNWRLWVHDGWREDGGALSSWILKVYPCPEPNRDFDSRPDSCDGCPDDARKIEPGICGCGVLETDSDGDGTPDCIDGCQMDAGKSAVGICGCGVSDLDRDGDTVPDCLDQCPLNINKRSPGVCGCDVPDLDANSNGVIDCLVVQEQTVDIRKRAIALRRLVNGFTLRSGKVKRQAIRRNYNSFVAIFNNRLASSGPKLLAQIVITNINRPVIRLLRQRDRTFAAAKLRILKSLDALLAAMP